MAMLLIGTMAEAKSTYLSTFKSRYQIANGSKFDTCYTCHVSGQSYTVRNPYGIDLKAANISSGTTAALVAVELIDSDHDGALNLTEIKHGTFPGNPDDVVATENTTWGKIKALYEVR